MRSPFLPVLATMLSVVLTGCGALLSLPPTAPPPDIGYSATTEEEIPMDNTPSSPEVEAAFAALKTQWVTPDTSTPLEIVRSYYDALREWDEERIARYIGSEALGIPKEDSDERSIRRALSSQMVVTIVTTEVDGDRAYVLHRVRMPDQKQVTQRGQEEIERMQNEGVLSTDKQQRDGQIADVINTIIQDPGTRWTTSEQVAVLQYRNQRWRIYEIGPASRYAIDWKQ